ncbi:dmX-like protein 1 [Hydra vulgaris]|uniref:dmX-like protein 1 n=1 Tax=Hydra vulgaris TaxID=6087 RepID=UPI0032E9F6A9
MLPKTVLSASKSDVKLDSFFSIASVSTTSDNRDIINVWCIDIELLGKYNTKTSVTPQSPDSILSNDSFSSMPVISSSHCLKQSHIYNDFLHESYKKICAASDLHCSNSLNPSCPLNFNFVTYSDESIKFWNFVLSEDEKDKNVCTLEELNDSLKEQGVIVCLNCASTELFAFVVELFDSNLNKMYNICIYENQSTGGLYWVKKQTIPIINVLVLEENMIELSWLHLENGSYLLALAFNNSIFIYNKDRKEFENDLQSSIWVVLKDFSLFDDKSPLRLTTISWSRGGFFMVGVENEIQVYSQWEDTEEVTLNNKTISLFDGGRVNEHGFIITKNSFTEACKSMCTLPQYHPYHLIELLNLGKLRRVRLILRDPGGLREIDIQLAKDMCSIGIKTTPGFKMCPSCRKEVVKKIDNWSTLQDHNGEDDFLEQTFFDENIEMAQEKELINTSFDKLDVSPVKFHGVPQHAKIPLGKRKLMQKGSMLCQKKLSVILNVNATDLKNDVIGEPNVENQKKS